MEKSIDKVLALLINSEDYLSGENIGNALGISRIAVNKHIKKLVQNGVNISISRKGYKYLKSDILTESTLRSKLLEKDIDLPVFVNAVESTNNEAKRLYTELNSQFLCVAPSQINGKGRMKRVFVSNEGGVYMTLCYKPHNLNITDSLKIVLLTGLAVTKILKKYVNNVSIKWPNDVFVNDKKICGILLESVVAESMTEAMFLGIGVNVFNEIPNNLLDIATSLKIEGVTNVTREDLIVEIIKLLFEMLNEYQKTGFSSFIDEYTNLSRTINHNVTVNANGDKKSGYAVGLSEEGYLLLKTDYGVEKIILGDIEA